MMVFIFIDVIGCSMKIICDNKKRFFIINFCMLIYNKFCISIIFSYFLSCIMHVLLIIVLAYKFFQNQVCFHDKKFETATFVIYQIDPFLHEVLQQKKMSTIVIPDNKKQTMTLIENNNRTEKNLDNTKNELNINNDASSSSAIQKNVNNVLLEKNFKSIFHSSKDISNNDNKIQKIIPCPLYRVYPEYPSHARILGVEGKLTVMYDVNNLGRIENIRILSANPVGVFEKNVRLAMRCWVYEKNKSSKNLTITFKFCFDSIELLDFKK